ncbi:hypothetical protein CHS0354_012377 [Potamilus streckersoni]|uniref:Caspase-2 n=1 Tax=Potamilus streckersoni TaxID=2493646 RepID=A0AAE0VX24_9BIVA|nr:hypothetical protein CHS0354_012377 [Potamilus streckersoni]
MMTPEQKEILITNRSRLVECLNVRDGLFTELIANKVMTQRNYRTICQSGRTPDQQAEDLLDFLARKGAADFEKFCDALIADNQETVVTEILRKSHKSDCRSHDPGCSKPVPVESESCNDTRFKRPSVDVTDFIHPVFGNNYAVDNRRSYGINDKRDYGGINDKRDYGIQRKYHCMSPVENMSGQFEIPEREVEQNEVYYRLSKMHDLIKNGGESFQKEELRHNLKHFVTDSNYRGFNYKPPFYDIDKVQLLSRLEEKELREKRERDQQYSQNSSSGQLRVCYKDNEKEFSGYNPSSLIPSDEEQFPYMSPSKSSLYEVHHIPTSPHLLDYRFLHQKSISSLPGTRLSRADSIDAMTKRPCDHSSPEVDGSGKRSRTDDVESAPLHIDRDQQDFVKFHDRKTNRIISIPLKSKLPFATQLETNRNAFIPQKLELLHPMQEINKPISYKSITDDPDLALTDGPVNVIVEKCTRQFYFVHHKQSYKMTRIPRGKALIINVNEVIGKSPRRGTNIDRDNLQNLFDQLHFETIVYNDKDELTARDIAIKLRMFADLPDHKNADACVVCLLSHGEEGCIFGTDGKKIDLDAIFSCFDNQCCEHLRGKPKLFIIQACRGGALDKGVRYTPDEHDGSDSVRSMQVPSQSDMVICFPTQYGYYAWRNRDRGSWYVEALVQVFMKYAKCEDVCTMLNRVNLLVSRKVSHCRMIEMDQMCQMSEYKSTLRMPHFYFFPGIGSPSE